MFGIKQFARIGLMTIQPILDTKSFISGSCVARFLSIVLSFLYFQLEPISWSVACLFCLLITAFCITSSTLVVPPNSSKYCCPVFILGSCFIIAFLIAVIISSEDRIFLPRFVPIFFAIVLTTTINNTPSFLQEIVDHPYSLNLIV